MNEFSAQYYLDMSEEEFAAEAESHGIKMYGRPRTNELVDAVYNSELQRRQDAKRQKTTVQPNAPAEKSAQDNSADASQYESYTVPELRDLADERGVDLGGASKKADIIAALEQADSDEANG